jgi:hypothetical protein
MKCFLSTCRGNSRKSLSQVDHDELAACLLAVLFQLAVKIGRVDHMQKHCTLRMASATRGDCTRPLDSSSAMSASLSLLAPMRMAQGLSRREYWRLLGAA